MSLRLKPVSFANALYYEDEQKKGTVMVDDYPDGRGWISATPYRERFCDILKGEDVEVLDEFVVQDNKNSIIKLRQTMEPDIDLIIIKGSNL